MTQDLQYTFSNSTDPFDDWFNDERAPLLEEDVDECVEDDYSDNNDEN